MDRVGSRSLGNKVASQQTKNTTDICRKLRGNPRTYSTAVVPWEPALLLRYQKKALHDISTAAFTNAVNRLTTNDLAKLNNVRSSDITNALSPDDGEFQESWPKVHTKCSIKSLPAALYLLGTAGFIMAPYFPPQTQSGCPVVPR